ncbi:MAG: winged helix-turn-helix transcriptional regulator [Selenomonas ruminantium]|uniref:Winged helix-turn-helix transcriptional regulator n=1 Tax=Selenomonas ruminantium TaxID=971 RepID=A0A927WN49_SELRU|nr:winged helix-turn-helix transcriptional regulator [Selenomonas ruminantium]
MYKRKTEPDIRCPLEYGMEVFGDKWKSRILCVLFAQNVLRYSELRAEMVDVTDSVLAASLKELQRDQLICRKVYEVIPPKVEYSLTDRGCSVIPILQEICRWSGMFYKDRSDKIMKQCERCDHR